MARHSDRFWRLVILGVLVAVTTAGGLAYVVDDLSVRYRMTRNRANDPLDTVTLYIATKLKNGQLEIFYNQPVTEVCVRALFPHLGHRPCWYVRRTPLKLVGRDGDDASRVLQAQLFVSVGRRPSTDAARPYST